MTEVTKIDGSPGAGKTHKQKQLLRKEKRERGVDVSDFMFLTFTRSATEDTREEVKQIFDVGDDMIEGAVRTLHSAALGQVRAADLIEDYDEQIITQQSERGKAENIYQEFADKHGMGYYGKSLRESRDYDSKSGAADKLYKLNTWLSLTQYDKEKAQLAPFPLPWNTKVAVDLLEKWDEYKRTRFPKRRFEHPDYLDLAIERKLFPDVDVLLIDEFQDLSPQEYLYYKLWRKNGTLDRVYLAGDPDQSIYSFRAGDPYYFMETDADNEVYLSESHRCRGEIATFARRVLNSGPGRKTEFSAAFDGGTVERVDGSQDDSLSSAVESALEYDAGAFMLARTNSQADSIARWLRSHGYPYSRLGSRRSMWDERFTDCLTALRRLRADAGGVDRDAVNRLMPHAPKSDLRQEVLDGHGDVYTVESVWRAFRDMDTIGEIVESLDFASWKRDALHAAATNPTGNEPADLKVGTIHTSKGLERPAVLLFNSSNSYIQQQYYERNDKQAEEHRIAYVGATRAARQLYVVDGFTDGPRMKPLQNALEALQ